MLPGGKRIILTRAYKPRVYKSLEPTQKQRTLEGPGTSNLDGHPDVKYAEGISAEDIYPLTDNIYGDPSTGIPHMKILVAKYLPPSAVSEVDIWDWSKVTTERGKLSYNKGELKEKIAREGLIAPSNAKKKDLVNFLLENKDRIEQS